MKIAVLTSSRADYGIYLPLLRALQADPDFDLRIIAFGTHLSSFHGYTVRAIEADGFRIDHRVEHILAADSPTAIATSMALASARFTQIWETSDYDLVFCLGDRYEMFAAVSAAAPFRIRFAHIHGGETTLGAIDNEFRHCLTVFSVLHFTTTEAYAQRVAAIRGSSEGVYAVGSLSLDSLHAIPRMNDTEFTERFGIDLSVPSLLVTFHPETGTSADNAHNARELVRALEALGELQVIITMPNADTQGNVMRAVYQDWAAGRPQVRLVENFGTAGYFTALDRCRLVVGNSSSGIIEAASFGKWVVNIGDRQQGRAQSDNMLNCPSEAGAIESACREGLARGAYTGTNIYYRTQVANEIIHILKNDRRTSV